MRRRIEDVGLHAAVASVKRPLASPRTSCSGLACSRPSVALVTRAECATRPTSRAALLMPRCGVVMDCFGVIDTAYSLSQRETLYGSYVRTWGTRSDARSRDRNSWMACTDVAAPCRPPLPRCSHRARCGAAPMHWFVCQRRLLAGRETRPSRGAEVSTATCEAQAGASRRLPAPPWRSPAAAVQRPRG